MKTRHTIGQITLGRYSYCLIENEDGSFDLDQYGDNSGGFEPIPQGTFQDFVLAAFEEFNKKETTSYNRSFVVDAAKEILSDGGIWNFAAVAEKIADEKKIKINRSSVCGAMSALYNNNKDKIEKLSAGTYRLKKGSTL